MEYSGSDMTVFVQNASSPRMFRWLLLLVFSLLAVTYYAWTWSHELGEFGGDNAIYILTARYFSPWSGPSEVAAYFASTSQYPPLFPFFLALFGGGESVLIAHLLTTTFLLLALIVFYRWLLSLGFSVLHASLIALLFLLLPGVYMEALSIHSENLYLLASLAGLMAITQAERSGRGTWYGIGALSIAAATLTRGAGISLVAAFIVYLTLRRPVRVWLYVIISVLPMMLWNLLHDKQGPSYVDSFVEKFSGASFNDLLTHISVELHALWYGWIDNFSVSPIALPVMGVIGAICLAGMVYRLWQRKLDGLYAAAYLLLILIWPFPAEAKRFIFIILPVLIVQGLLFVGALPRAKLGHRYLDGQIMVLLCIFLVTLPALALTTSRFMHHLPDELAHLKHNTQWYALDPRNAMNNAIFDNAIANHLRQIKGMVPKESCIYSIKPSIVGFYADRISIVSPRPYFDQAAFDAYLKQKNCRYFYLMGIASTSFPTTFYPLTRLQSSLQIINVAHTTNPSVEPISMLAELVQRY